MEIRPPVAKADIIMFFSLGRVWDRKKTDKLTQVYLRVRPMNLMLGWEHLSFEFMYSSFLSDQQTSMAFVRNVTAETEIQALEGFRV